MIRLNFSILPTFVLMTSVLVACNQPETPAVAPYPGRTQASSPLALTADGDSLWVVNPDADSVTRIDTETLKADVPVAVGREPWGVAVTPGGEVVVLNRAEGTLSVLRQSRLVATIAVGPEPGGGALSPSGRLAFVSVSSADELVTVDLKAGRVVNRQPVGRLPWAVAVTNDGDADEGDETVVVTHRLARTRAGSFTSLDERKEGWLSVIRGSDVSEIALTPYRFGFPNALEGLALVGDQVWVAHLLNSPDLPRDFKSSVSGGLSTVSLSALAERPDHRVETNEPSFSTPTNFPRAVAVTPDGQRAYVVLAGTNAVMGIDLTEPDEPKLLGFWGVGDNPRGIVLDRVGTTAYVMNYLSRDVSVLDLTDTVRYPEVARIPVAPETLEPAMLRGKLLFNNANDPRISNLGWMSCASCHVDGGADGTTWGTPEGMRQTMPLWNLEGTAPFHASATRDEVQDFEGDIERFMDGVGLAPGPANELLGGRNGSVSADLDALAAFVLNGTRVPRAPAMETQAAARGRVVFEQAGCASCHGGRNWTRSTLPGGPGRSAVEGEEVVSSLVDVGTFDPAGDVFGKRGFDVPTLLGVHGTAPYLHDGSAATLGAVLQNDTHTSHILDGPSRADLIALLNSVDATTEPLE